MSSGGGAKQRRRPCAGLTRFFADRGSAGDPSRVDLNKPASCRAKLNVFAGLQLLVFYVYRKYISDRISKISINF
jgi:hypothetical protein